MINTFIDVETEAKDLRDSRKEFYHKFNKSSYSAPITFENYS